MPKTREVAELMAAEAGHRHAADQARFRQVTQPAFDEAFENGSVYQAEAYASGEPQETMRASLPNARPDAKPAPPARRPTT